MPAPNPLRRTNRSSGQRGAAPRFDPGERPGSVEAEEDKRLSPPNLSPTRKRNLERAAAAAKALDTPVKESQGVDQTWALV